MKHEKEMQQKEGSNSKFKSLRLYNMEEFKDRISLKVFSNKGYTYFSRFSIGDKTSRFQC